MTMKRMIGVIEDRVVLCLARSVALYNGLLDL